MARTRSGLMSPNTCCGRSTPACESKERNTIPRENQGIVEFANLGSRMSETTLPTMDGSVSQIVTERFALLGKKRTIWTVLEWSRTFFLMT